VIEHLRAMARNNAWSNHRLLNACARLSPAEYVARRTSFFPSIRATLNHILMVDGYYIDSLEDMREAAVERALAFVEHESFAALDAAQRASDRRLLAFCDGLDESSLEVPVVMKRPGREAPAERVEDVLSHLFVHQIHHRGQAHAMLCGTSVKPPQLDEFFMRDELALRRDELRELGLPQR
jgi:uncharacterized damage-inducible protein DinB